MLKALAEPDARLNGNELVVRFRLSEVKTLDLLNRARKGELEVEGFSSGAKPRGSLFFSLTSPRGDGLGIAA